LRGGSGGVGRGPRFSMATREGPSQTFKRAEKSQTLTVAEFGPSMGCAIMRRTLKPMDSPNTVSICKCHPKNEFQLGFWIWFGSATLRVVSFLDGIFLPHPRSRKRRIPPFAAVCLRYFVIGVWKTVCVRLWEVRPCGMHKRHLCKEANPIFQRLSKIITTWNAMFALNCWPDDDLEEKPFTR